MSSPSTTSAWQTSVLFGAVFTSAVAPLLINTIPAINAALAQDLGVEAGMLGAFSSAASGGATVAALSVVALTRLSSPRATVLVGLGLEIIGYFLSAVFDWGAITIVLAVLGGVGAGLSLTACTYMFGFGNTERNYAASMLSLMGLGAIWIGVMPTLNDHVGWRGLFIVLTLLLLPAIYLTRPFPRYYEVEQVSTSPVERVSRVPQWIGLGAVILGISGQSAFLPYLGSIGVAAGFTSEAVASSLSFSGIGGFLGAVLSVTLGSRQSTMMAIALVDALAVIGALAGNSHASWVYTAGISAFYCSIPLIYTAQFGLLMRRAPSKSFAVSISAAQFLGTALGPITGGLIIERYGYKPLQAFSIASAVSAYCLLAVYVALGRPSATAADTQLLPAIE
jgi:predicted MFS family arabinose efflux permease